MAMGSSCNYSGMGDKSVYTKFKNFVKKETENILGCGVLFWDC